MNELAEKNNRGLLSETERQEMERYLRVGNFLNLQQVRNALKLIAPLPIVWVTEVDCTRALSDFTVYQPSHSLGLLDALIANCAVGLGATLCNFNVKHYRVVPGLVIAQPYAR
jgi:predicted nucleic acid-binding protein